MNRRSFLGLTFGGVAATAAVRTFPFRVFSFPTQIAEPQVRIKFVRAFDPQQAKFVSRWDMLYGYGSLEVGRESMRVTGIHIPPSEDEWPTLSVVRA